MDEKEYFEVVWSSWEEEKWRACEESVWVKKKKSRREGRSIVRMNYKVKEYLHERGVDRGDRLNKQGWSMWVGRAGGSSAMAIPLGDISGEYKVSETFHR